MADQLNRTRQVALLSRRYADEMKRVGMIRAGAQNGWVYFACLIKALSLMARNAASDQLLERYV